MKNRYDFTVYATGYVMMPDGLSNAEQERIITLASESNDRMLNHSMRMMPDAK